MREMKKFKFILGLFAILIAALAIFFVLRSENALLTHPKGVIARSELDLISINYLLMLMIVIPTFALLFWVVWKYSAKNSRAKYDPDKSHGGFKEVILWIIPLIAIVPMAVITWYAAHKLDPYQPIGEKQMTIQVVAMDWKWLFIYPEQRIAAVNWVQFPEKTPIRFELAADGSPMNSFWIPQLSGQIYAMTGMTTQIHMMADGPGIYTGRAAEINGAGFADMTFIAKSTSMGDFEEWVGKVKESPLQLNEGIYQELVKPSQKHPIELYSNVESGLFHKIVMKYMHHP